MTPEEQLRSDFADDTAYERIVLEMVAETGKAPPGTEFAIDDIRGDGPKHFGIGVHEFLGFGAAREFAERVRPLALGAAYKLFDLLVEATMRLNGMLCRSGRWTFKDKVSFLGTGAPLQLPVPLDSEPDIWIAVKALYVDLDEHRHALVHRRARVEPNGDFTGSDRSGTPLSPVSPDEQAALIRLSLVLSSAVIDGTNDARQLNSIRWNLDVLRPHHGGPLTGATPPAPVVRRVIDDLGPLSPGRWRLDGAKLHAHLRQQGARPLDADVELHGAQAGGQVVFGAHAYDIPDAVVEVEASHPPSWLRTM